MSKKLPNKLIISGRVIETYSYEKPPPRNYALGRRNYSKRTYRDNASSEYAAPLARNKTSLQRSRSQIIRLINSNPGLIKFITLTFKDAMTDLGRANYEFNKFAQRLRYHNNGDLKYIAIPEYQARGAVHYHMLCNLGHIDDLDLASLWTNGFIKIKNISDMPRIGLYISKYLKEGSDDPRLFGRRSYLASRNINRPVVHKSSTYQNSAELNNAWEGLKLYESLPASEKIYESSYLGKIIYRQYELRPNDSKDSRSAKPP